MSDSRKPPSQDLLGALPRSRPQRRSSKRAATPGTGGTPGHGEPPPERSSSDLLEATVRTAAELAEISLTAGARIVRAAVSWLPKP